MAKIGILKDLKNKSFTVIKRDKREALFLSGCWAWVFDASSRRKDD